MPPLKKTYRFSNLRAWREATFDRQMDAAEFLSLNQGQYSKFERGLQFPRPQRAKVISEKTGVPLERLLGIS